MAAAPMDFRSRASGCMTDGRGCARSGKRHCIRLLRRGYNKHQTRDCEQSEKFLHRQTLLHRHLNSICDNPLKEFEFPVTWSFVSVLCEA
jgi:hypothetical protein